MMKPSVYLLLLFLRMSSASTYQNVALRGKATQSTYYESPMSPAQNAIDGNHNSEFSGGSCTHTNEQMGPWWRVDLLQSYIITSVIITNREDCCQNRLIGLEIHIGNSLTNEGLANPKVGTLSEVNTEHTNVTFAERVEGRYVTLTLPGPQRILTLCEVEVYGYPAPTGGDLSYYMQCYDKGKKAVQTYLALCGKIIDPYILLIGCSTLDGMNCNLAFVMNAKENLALQGKATQSSRHSSGIAYNAIDGNRNSKWDEASCTLTLKSKSPWWRLDLRKTHKVFTVNVVNQVFRPERLNGAEIRIGNSLENNGNNNPRCAVITSIAGGAVADFTCNGMEGRYVNIIIPEREEFLSLCEVEVYGSRLD